MSTQLDPQVLQLSPDAELFYLRAWLYIGEHCTDGVIPPSALPVLSMKLASDPAAIVEELKKSGLVKRRRNNDVIEGYLDVNPTAAQVTKRSDHGRKAAIARWAKEKPQSESDLSDGDSGHDSDADGAWCIASGIDGQSNEDADGNAPHDTRRDVTNETPAGVGIESLPLSEEIYQKTLDGECSTRDDEWSPTAGQRRQRIAETKALDEHFSGTFDDYVARATGKS